MLQIAYIFLMMAAAIAVLGYDGRPSTVLAGAVVFYNWCAGMLYVLVTGDTAPAWAFLLFDTLSLAVVARAPGVPLQMLAASYVGQIAMHFLRIIGGGDPLYYWQILTFLGMMQLVLLIVAALLRPRSGTEHGFG